MDTSLSVLMISTSYPKTLTDWRGLFIRHLADALGDREDIRLKLWAPLGEHANAVQYACSSAESQWLNALMEQGGIAHLLRQRKSLSAPVKLLWLLRQAYKRHPKESLFHVNWLQNALPLFSLPGKQAALISVLGTDIELLNLPGMRFCLRQVLRQRPCMLAPNADWMVPILKEYFGDLAQIQPIPFGIDKNWYSLQRNWRKPSRKWLVVSRLTHNKIGPLFEWGKEYFKNGQELHLFGPMQENLEIPDWVHYHGPTHPQDLLENWFPQAAGLLTLSRHAEGRPQVMLEAMAAGLPIIASRLPAHDNLLRHRQTGCLVECKKDFLASLEWLTEPEVNEKMGREARTWVAGHIGTWANCAQRYVDAYRSLLGA